MSSKTLLYRGTAISKKISKIVHNIKKTQHINQGIDLLKPLKM